MSDVMIRVTFTLLWCVVGWLPKASCGATLAVNISEPVTTDRGVPVSRRQYRFTSGIPDTVGGGSVMGRSVREDEGYARHPTSPLTSGTDVDTPPSTAESTGVTSVIVTSPTSGQVADEATTAKLLSPGARPLSDEEELLHTLFQLAPYNPSARPVINSSNTVSVKIQFSLMHIKDLDVRSQILTTTGLLILVWVDERLKWNPEDHNNMKDIVVEAEHLWTPEFAVINGAEKIYEDYDQFRAVVTHEGEVHWEPGGVFRTMCTIDITYYPFDEQVCDLTFGAWSYHTSKMNLTTTTDIINLDSYNENGEWDISATGVIRKEFSYVCCPNERYSNVKFKIYLRRRHMFYILNVILPSIMTSVLLLSIFFCTPGQKVQIGVVVLLSFRIFLLNVAGEIPKTSDHIPLLGIYLTCTMAITTLSMVLTVFVLNLHHINDRPVPGWAKKLVFCYMARALGMCSSSANHSTEGGGKSDRGRHSRSSAGFFRRSYAGFENDVDETAAIMELQNQTRPPEKTPPGGGREDHAVDESLESPWVLRNSINTRLAHQVAQRAANAYAGAVQHAQNNHVCSGSRPPEPADRGRHGEQDARAEEDHSKDWKRMAEVFDRLFFWLFLFAIVITTLVLFHPLTKSYINQTRKAAQ